MNINERIKHRRLELGLSADELAESLGVSRATIYRYESGDIKKLPVAFIKPLADALGVSPAYLMGWEDLDPLTLKNVFPYKTKKLPLLGSIACGEPILAEENIEDYIQVLEEIEGNYCLRCRGDSMINAGIADGNIVVINEQPAVENGEIAAVLIEDGFDTAEATLKRVYVTSDTLTLVAENPAYAPLVFRGEDMNLCRVIGKAVAVVKPL